MSIKQDEIAIIGAWITNQEGRVVGDAAQERIHQLLESHLELIETGNWEALYQDPCDGRYWELTYPKSHMHGGGPTALHVISRNDAVQKYKVSPD